jgi:hypothetical protein
LSKAEKYAAKYANVNLNIDLNELNCKSLDFTGNSDSTITVAATGSAYLNTDLKVVNNVVYVGVAGYYFPVTVAYYQTGIDLLYGCIDSETVNVTDANGQPMIPDQYLNYLSYMSGMHLTVFAVLQDPTLTSPDYSNLKSYMKSVPISDGSGVSGTMANFFGMLGIGKSTWRDLT